MELAAIFQFLKMVFPLFPRRLGKGFKRLKFLYSDDPDMYRLYCTVIFTCKYKYKPAPFVTLAKRSPRLGESPPVREPHKGVGIN